MLVAQFATSEECKRRRAACPKYIVFMRVHLGGPTLLFVVSHIRKHGPACFPYAGYVFSRRRVVSCGVACDGTAAAQLRRIAGMTWPFEFECLRSLTVLPQSSR